MSRHFKLSRQLLLACLLIALCAPLTAQAEHGLELSYLKPTGLFGQVIKGSPALRYTRTFGGGDQLLQRKVFVGLHKFFPQADTVETGYYVGKNPYTNQFDNDVFIGTREIVGLAIYATFGAQMLMRPWRSAAVRPYGIVEFHGMVGQLNRTVLSAGLNSEVAAGDVGASIGAGGGVEYLTTGKFTFYLNVVRNYNYSNELTGFVYWNTAFGATYLF